ncbi:TMhelix containing protein [Vibrio phage 1.101.O._10N.261.45.C6]|nr:TMhelix containing protein [Vibrio phage 1.101.O._10N.261.45.C6]
MSPLLLPIVLFLYAEFSGDKVTRKLARVLLYANLLATTLSLYSPDAQSSLISSCVIYVGAYIYCTWKTPSIPSKILFMVVTGCCFLFYMTIINDIWHWVEGYRYFYDNVKLIFREGLILAIALTSSTKLTNRRDFYVEMVIIFIYILEKLLI